MAELNVLNSKFDAAGKLETLVSLTPEDINVAVIHQVVKATLASRRQGNASVKCKALVAGGGKKPFKQKGTGNARQGSNRSPLMPGGGSSFGPQPRSYEQKINKKTMLGAIHSVLADKFQAGKLTVVSELQSTGKTKEMFNLLSKKGLLPGLVVTDSKDSLALRACRNFSNAKAVHVDGFSVYEAIKFENLIIEKKALETLLTKLV
ncbi:MAG: 50S ribosomal protein L4 [Bdellovibrionota bacterium]